MNASVILHHEDILRKMKRIAFQILEKNCKSKEIIFAGINGNGYVFATHLKKYLDEISDLEIILCEVHLNKKNVLEKVTIDIPKEKCADKPVVLVDDVLYTGKTLIYGVKYFLDIPLLYFKTAVLVNRSHKIFPVKADFKGISLSTSLKEKIVVDFSEKNNFIAYLT